jgi:hypothetical protein
LAGTARDRSNAYHLGKLDATFSELFAPTGKAIRHEKRLSGSTIRPAAMTASTFPAQSAPAADDVRPGCGSD